MIGQRFAKLSRAKKLVIVAAVGLYFVIGVTGGCIAYRRPPALNADERALLLAAPLPYAVTVAWWDEQTKTGQSDEAYAGSLAKIVKASGAFRTSRYEQVSAPTGQDLVATSTGLYCNSAVIPGLGIIPTVFQDEKCQGMLLRAVPGQPKSAGVEVEVRYKGPVIMGWVAVIAGLLPGWSHGEVAGDPRFAERFRLAVIERRADIERVVGHTGN